MSVSLRRYASGPVCPFRRNIAMPETSTPTLPASSAPPRGTPSAAEPDWRREHKRLLQWDPGRSLLASLRRYQRYRDSRAPWAPVLRRIAVLQHRFWSAVSGADIPLRCNIGGGLLLPHPNGIVIHPEAHIGPNCLIFQQVTLGIRGRDGAPVVGGHVDIGAGAKVLGAVRLGDHARIGANAVVLHDVPAGADAVGIPARILNKRVES